MTVIWNQLITLAVAAKVDYFFVGGSLVISTYVDECIQFIKRNVPFRWCYFQATLHKLASTQMQLLYLSLISGRNAELLIGQHVVSAPIVKKSGVGDFAYRLYGNRWRRTDNGFLHFQCKPDTCR